MSYKYYYSSIKGTSHEKTNTQKQDDLCVSSFDVNNTNYLISAIADGAGTAKHSDISSKHICKFLNKKMSNWLKTNEISTFNQDLICSWIRQFQQILNRYIRFHKLESIRDFATTILFAVLSDNGNIFVQIGDGAISIGNSTELNCVFHPQKGEYANTTHFATEEHFENSLMFKFINENIERLAMHTDGIETISLINLEKPSLSFFNPFFDGLNDELAGLNVGLCEELSEFLSSDRVNKRTNDDKTLVIAMRMECNG